MWSVTRVTSAQKLPTVCVEERTNPRVSAKAIARPVAADRKLWTVSPSIWVRLLIVVSPE